MNSNQSNEDGLKVRFFESINESHEATGFHGRTDLPEIHVFTLEETYPETRRVMPPYRRGFYQMSFQENSADATLNLETESFGNRSKMLYFIAPEHVFSWVRGEKLTGVIIYFKKELLNQLLVPISQEFPFFAPTEMNVFSLSTGETKTLKRQFSAILKIFRSKHPYRLPMLSAMTTALLYECRALYDLRQVKLSQQSPGKALAWRFEQMVEKQIYSHRTVEDFADLLNVSPDHLSDTVRKNSGRSPREIIAERIAVEAKRLLIYSELSVSEIAFQLNYSEPTHFARFFKRLTGMTPNQFRKEKRGLRS